jgi:hypothetical protein
MGVHDRAILRIQRGKLRHRGLQNLQFVMGIACVHPFAGVAGEFHAQFRRYTRVGQTGGKAVPQRVEGPA